MPGPEPGHRRRCGLGAALLLPVLACAGAGNSAPRGFLPRPIESQQDGYGGWIELTVSEGKKERQVEGELIAVSTDTVWVLRTSGGAVVVPTAQVAKGKLTGYQAATEAVAGYTLLGTVSTLSNGWLLIFTAPLWIISGTVATVDEAHAPRRSSPPLTWADLTAYARFPQGLPEGVALGELTPKGQR